MNKAVLLIVRAVTLFAALITFLPLSVAAQEPFEDGVIYVIVTVDGGEFIGTIQLVNSNEIVIRTQTLGDVAIPKYHIESVRKHEAGFVGELSDRKSENVFSTRYLFTTNALPIEAGNHYFNISPLGPDVQFAVAENLGVGLLSTWVGVPLVVSIKYSVPTSGIVRFGLGALVASGTYFDPDLAGILPFGVMTFGNRLYNFSLSGGYFYFVNGNVGTIRSDDFESQGSFLASASGMAKLTRNLTLVFDTVLVPEERVAVLAIPLIRWQDRDDRAWQVGFAGTVTADEFTIPVPVIQWYRKLD